MSILEKMIEDEAMRRYEQLEREGKLVKVKVWDKKEYEEDQKRLKEIMKLCVKWEKNFKEEKHGTKRIANQ